MMENIHSVVDLPPSLLSFCLGYTIANLSIQIVRFIRSFYE